METVNPTAWISPSFSCIQNEQGKQIYMVSHVAFQEIAQAIQTPFYLYDLHTIENQYQALSHAFHACGIQIYYSVKANTSLAIVDVLQALGSGLEIASEGELAVAKLLKVNPKKVSFAGPVKTDRALKEAIQYGVGMIHGESIEEFSRIDGIAKKLGVIQTVGIRVNPIKEVAEAGGLMGGGPRKFGIDEELLTAEVIYKIRSLHNIRLAGLHVFSATQMLSEKVFLENFQNICDIAEKLHALYPIQAIDFGGGLGIPYHQAEKPLPLASLSKKIQKIVMQYSFIGKNNIKLFIEPGRFLVGASGIYVTQVNNVKKSRGRNMILVDGGIHHLLRPALFPGTTAHPIYNISQIQKPATKLYDIGGALCTSLDFLGKDIKLPVTEVGDFLGVYNTGAYGWSESMPYFLSHSTPAEIAVYHGEYTVIRDQLSAKDFVHNQRIAKRRGRKKI